MTYEQALAAPTGPGGKGWKYADETSTRRCGAGRSTATPASRRSWCSRARRRKA
jgi:hypothetical protein